MEQRFFAHLPTVLILLSIFVITQLYLKLMSKKMSREIHSLQWIKSNWSLTYILFGFPTAVLSACTIEEVIFRGPLVILFPQLNSHAWFGIVISSIIFGLVHFNDSLLYSSNVLFEDEEEMPESDNLEEQVVHQESITNKEQSFKFKLIRVAITTPLGFFLGYIAVSNQSLWASVMAHAIWNLVMPVALPIFGLLGLLVIYYIQGLWARHSFNLRVKNIYKQNKL